MVCSRELFYQLVLRGFAAFSTLNLQPPAPLVEVLEIALLRRTEADAQPDRDMALVTAKETAEFLLSKADMLDEYFGISMTADGQLRALPVLLDKYGRCRPDLEPLHCSTNCCRPLDISRI